MIGMASQSGQLLLKGGNKQIRIGKAQALQADRPHDYLLEVWGRGQHGIEDIGTQAFQLPHRSNLARTTRSTNSLRQDAKLYRLMH
jgi:hypothetical protein